MPDSPRHSWTKDAPHPSAGIVAQERQEKGAVVEAELHWKLSHVAKCCRTFPLGVTALRVSFCCCCEGLGWFQAAKGRDPILCCEEKGGCNHLAKLPELQVKPCSFPARINGGTGPKITQKGRNEGGESQALPKWQEVAPGQLEPDQSRCSRAEWGW